MWWILNNKQRKKNFNKNWIIVKTLPFSKEKWLEISSRFFSLSAPWRNSFTLRNADSTRMQMKYPAPAIELKCTKNKHYGNYKIKKAKLKNILLLYITKIELTRSPLRRSLREYVRQMLRQPHICHTLGWSL